MYQIEVFTTSESEETRIVRFNPRAVQQAVESSFKSKIQVGIVCWLFSRLWRSSLSSPRSR
jgi:hypothetical protein